MKDLNATLPIVITGILLAITATPSNAQDNYAAERACRDAARHETGDRNVRVIDSEFSQAATEVILEADGRRWTCLSSSDGRVSSLERSGYSSSNRYHDDSRYEERYEHHRDDRYNDNEGVTLYEDADFRGTRETVYRDVRDMDDTRIGEDQLSSIEVPSGCRVRLYSEDDFEGRSMSLDRDEANLRNTSIGNDNVESIEVDCGHRGSSHGSYDRDRGVTLYEDIDYRGASDTLYRDEADLDRTRVGGDNLSSIRVPSNCTVWIYDDEDFRGRSYELRGDNSDLRHSPIGNDEAESIEVDCR